MEQVMQMTFGPLKLLAGAKETLSELLLVLYVSHMSMWAALYTPMTSNYQNGQEHRNIVGCSCVMDNI
jgi:hypothetical protein